MAIVVRGGVRLHYTDRGDGPAVFFHTGGGGDGSMWARAGYPEALPGRRCLLFDHRGHGRSDQPTQPAAHDFDEYLADVSAVLDDAGVSSATFVGYSDGAVLGFGYAARYPERVNALIGIGVADDPDESPAWRRELAAEVRAVTLRTLLQRMSDRESDPAPDWLMDNLSTTTTEMFALELEGWADQPPIGEALARIAAPTLIISGGREDAEGGARLMAGRIAGARLVLLPDCDHLRAFCRTDLSGPVIREFLDRHVPLPEANPAPSPAAG